jgi:hypothetical protein
MVPAILPYGQWMTRTTQLAVEIRFVPLPTKELDERRERLRALLLRGALRWVRQHPEGGSVKESRVIEALLAGVQK